jgi:hypothetical protein
MTSTILSKRLILVGYGFLTLLYSYATIINSIDNFSGNRNIASIFALIYFSIMFVGLIKFTKPFAFLSCINFVACIAGTVYIQFLILSGIEPFIVFMMFLGCLGLFFSAQTFRGSNGI